MKIVFLDAKTCGDDIDYSFFNELGDVKIYSTTRNEEALERMLGYDVVIVNKVLLDKDKLSKLPDLKLVCVAATGVNNVDLDYCKENNIAICNVAGYSTESVTQHTFAMLFYLLGKLNYYDDYVKSLKYANSDIFTCLDKPYPQISGKVFGIIGLGTIGKNVAKVAEAFGCEVCYYSTSGQNTDSTYERKSLEELLSVSDIVSIHAPLNKSTYNLIGYEELKLMKSSSVLLNLGRGGIVNETDLAKALDEGLIAGAGLDVLEKEPMDKENPLLNIKDKEKLFITPHIAWASKEARMKLMREVFFNIDAFINGTDRNRVV